MKRREFVQASVLGSAFFALPSLMFASRKGRKHSVLILGDSISIGYTPYVKEALKEVAIVSRPLFENGKNENCQGTLHGLKNIDRWLGTTRWDIIHFNFGLHDLKHVDPVTGKNSTSPEDPLQSDIQQYTKNLEHIVKRLRKTKAKLIFATTTPYPDELSNAIRDPKAYVDYNRTALQIMEKEGIAINDLCKHIVPYLDTLQLPKNVHFKKEGSQFLAKAVVEAIQTTI